MYTTTPGKGGAFIAEEVHGVGGDHVLLVGDVPILADGEEVLRTVLQVQSFGREGDADAAGGKGCHRGLRVGPQVQAVLLPGFRHGQDQGPHVGYRDLY